METVYFEEKDHRYKSKDNYYTSVSGAWKSYFPDFDGELISLKMAFRDLDNKVYNETKRLVPYKDPRFVDAFMNKTDIPLEDFEEEAFKTRELWRLKRELGTAFHKKKELEDIGRGYLINPFTGKKQPVIEWKIKEGYENQSFEGDLYKEIPDGYKPEHLVTSNRAYLAGQLDKNFFDTIGKTRFVDIDDWKTDGDMLITPKFKDFRKGYETLKYPFDHIVATNFWKYTMKLSTYARMLEELGFVVRNIALTHVEINEDLEILKEQRFMVPYKRQEAKLIIDFLGY